jgi:hypothetical protein
MDTMAASVGAGERQLFAEFAESATSIWPSSKALTPTFNREP